MPKVIFGRVAIPATFANTPQAPGQFNATEENQFRADVERAFLKLPVASSGGGGGGGGADALGHYLVNSATNKPSNATVVQRALGPDATPASPNAMDDEMVTSGTGYNPAIWTNWSHVGETYALDAFGGLAITPGNDSTICGIEQPLSTTGNWAFVAKVANGAPAAAGNAHIGITLRYSAGYIRFHAVSMVSGNYSLYQFEFTSPTGYSGTLTNSNVINQQPGQWVYLRVRGTGTASPVGVVIEYSLNGVTWRMLSNGAYPDPIDYVGLAVYQADTNIGPLFCQFFRRTV